MPAIHSVAVFCGSSIGHDPAHRASAEALGRGLAVAGKRLIYGGGRVGLMGALADAAMAAGGQVTGIIPAFLVRWEVAHETISTLETTDTMHARKLRMFELADAFVALPGGLGTADETIELLTWRQLRLHDKPIVLCDVAGSARPLVALIEAAVEAGFARAEVRDFFAVADGVEDALRRVGA